MREVRALAIDRADGALAAMRAQRAERVHLLEERGQVLGLRDGGELAELDEAASSAASDCVQRRAGGGDDGEPPLAGGSGSGRGHDAGPSAR